MPEFTKCPRCVSPTVYAKSLALEDDMVTWACRSCEMEWDWPFLDPTDVPLMSHILDEDAADYALQRRWELARAVGLTLLLVFRGNASWGIQVLAHNDTPLPGLEWLQWFDVEAHDGRGDGQSGVMRSHALRFASAHDALAFWKTQSTRRPLRNDGKPNRPLTALSVSPREIPVGVGR